MEFDPRSETFWDQGALEGEMRRVFDICHGCRRCFNLCPSFNFLFDAIGKKGEDAAALTADDFKSVVDLCYQCKLCFNHCPYSPPHRWDIDFPRLMLRARSIQAKLNGISLQDKVLGQTDKLGRAGSAMAPISNVLIKLRPVRAIMEKTIGIHRDRNLPEYSRETFDEWFRSRRQGASDADSGKVALFYTCYVNYNDPAVGRDLVRVLERNHIAVVAPKQRCCGMPALDGGDIESALQSATYNVEQLAQFARQGYDIISPGPTCSYMLKSEYPVLLKTEDARLVSSRTFDACEYLMRLHEQRRLDMNFKPTGQKVSYHLPCHLRAQNIGYKSRDLMMLIPGTKVQVIERCSGVDGTWGLKKQYYQLSLNVAGKLFKEVSEDRADLVASDCPLAGLQIAQGTGRRPLHPVQVLARAYGIAEEEKR
jgi:glycerol-3-phosphate dehydrogenase subunit C